MSFSKGIAIAGNMILDQVKRIRSYPAPGMLADITDVSRSVGGCVCNTLIDLAILEPALPLEALGCLGRDEAGDFVLAQLRARGIGTDRVLRHPTLATSFSDCMSDLSTGERTFFHYRGANAAFSPADVDLDTLEVGLLHVGYALLLDGFDAADPDYGTAMARFLHDAQARGIRTCIDAVSDSAGRFADVVTPALAYADYAIMNEIEGCAVAGIPPRDEKGHLLPGHLHRALECFLRAGVRRRAVLHCPEAGFCLEADGTFTVVPSFRLPEGYIQGSTGAGDAFCAGCLYAIHHDLGAEEMLRLGASAAAANLSRPDSVSGMISADALRTKMQNWETRTL